MLDCKCAFDESGTDDSDSSPVLCVAGYIIESEAGRELDREWNAVLNWDELPEPLPYFHMSEIAPDPGNGPFRALSKDQRIEVVRRMIGIIKRRTVIGIAATLTKRDFEEILTGHPFYPDPYVLVAHTVLQGVALWIKENQSENGRMAYFFEAGHKSRRHADALMQQLFNTPQFEGIYHYVGHAFMPKIGNPAVQAADLLAWQCLKDRKNEREGRPRRKDIASLLEHPHKVVHFSREALAKLTQSRDDLIRYFSETSGGQCA